MLKNDLVSQAIFKTPFSEMIPSIVKRTNNKHLSQRLVYANVMGMLHKILIT